ncbi:MAG: YraN family protein [Bacteroidaceae bacterium]|jgi:putative endonuclease|nr:YraN family protein [Bacteroidaceae bacterium]
MSTTWDLGQNGEELAADYLMKQGYRILHRNWNLHKGCELDIVATKDNQLHFIEVKTRSRVSDVYGRPEQAINDAKLRNIVRAIYRYQNIYHLDMDMHIDAIGVVYHSEQDYTINFMPDIAYMPFNPSGRAYGYGHKKKGRGGWY